jgi:hypothetical protein
MKDLEVHGTSSFCPAIESRSQKKLALPVSMTTTGLRPNSRCRSTVVGSRSTYEARETMSELWPAVAAQRRGHGTPEAAARAVGASKTLRAFLCTSPLHQS